MGMCGSWEKFMVYQRKSRRVFNQVKLSDVLTEPSHDLHACGKCSHAYRHIFF